MKRPNLFVVWQVWIDRVHRCLHLFPGHASRDDRRKISTPVTHKHRLLGSGQMSQQFIFDRLGRDVVARAENNQVLDAPDDPPVPCRINFALVAGMKPSLAQRPWRFPVDGSNIREKCWARAQ